MKEDKRVKWTSTIRVIMRNKERFNVSTTYKADPKVTEIQISRREGKDLLKRINVNK